MFVYTTIEWTVITFKLLNFRPNNLTNDIGPRMSLNLRDSTYFAAIASHRKFFFV